MRQDQKASQPLITATAQQSRFHSATFDAGANLDLELLDVTLTIGGLDVLEGANIVLRSGVRYGLTGRNGCGKSTVLQALVDRIIPGIPPSLRMHLVTQVDPGPAEGDISVLQYVLDGHVERRLALQERDKLTRALESADPSESQRLLDEVLFERAQSDLENKRRVALRRSGARGKVARADEIKAEEALAEAQKRLEACVITDDWSLRATELLNEVQAVLEVLDVNATEAQARRILRGLGFNTKKIEGRYNKLSGGWRSRCRLATALLVQVDLLMLDEPSNFMDLESVLFLEHYLSTSSTYSILLLTSHDQVFLDRLAEKTVAVRHNRLDYFDGAPSLMIRTEEEERRSKEKVKDAMDKKKEHIEASIAQGRKTAKATGDDNRMRMVKSRTKKLEDRWGVERSAKGTRFKLNRDLAGYHLTSRAAVETEGPEKAVSIRLPEAPPLKIMGSLVSMEGVSVGYKGKMVVEGVTITLHQGGRLALVGANGQGKSTLVKAIMGELSPLRGSINLHVSVKIGYFSQHAVEELKDHEGISALEYFQECLEARGQTLTEVEARSTLGRVGLGAVAKVHIGGMSGGQKVRLALAIVLASSPNLLILDEVTTHLDAPTIRALASALTEYKGGIILISHDRWFSSVVVEGKPVEEDASASSCDDENNDISQPGQTWLVDKGAVKLLERGMEQYEEIVEKRLRKRAKKEGWEVP